MTTSEDYFVGSYSMDGHAFAFRTTVVAVAEVVEDLLAHLADKSHAHPTRYEAVAKSGGPSRFALYRDDELVQSASSEGAIVDYLLWDANQRALASSTRVALHAAAASWDEQGIVLPAAMDSGKTTLAAGLVLAGFSYLSDEATLIDPDTGRLHPFAKPLWMEPPTVRLLDGLYESLPSSYRRIMKHNYHVPPKRLRPGCVGLPCEVRYVIAPSYAPGSVTSLELMDGAEALMVLARNSFNLRTFGAAGIAILGSVVEQASSFRLTVGDLPSAVGALRELVSS